MSGRWNEMVGSRRDVGETAPEIGAFAPRWGSPPAELGWRSLKKTLSLPLHLGVGGGALLVGQGNSDSLGLVRGDMWEGDNGGKALVNGEGLEPPAPSAARSEQVGGVGGHAMLS